MIMFVASSQLSQVIKMTELLDDKNYNNELTVRANNIDTHSFEL